MERAEILVNCANPGKFLSAIDLWRIPQDSPDAERLAGLLSPGEQARAARFRFPLDRRRFIARHAALRQILAGYLAQAPESLAFTSGARGKPLLSGLHFSLSASGAYAVCAISRDQPLGVDVEQQRPLADLDDLARACLTPAENKIFQTLADKNQAFFTWWTAKEAALKALGLGLGGGLKSLEFDWETRALRLAPELARVFPRLFYHAFTLAPAYPAALASPLPNARFAFREWTG
jgi:4'-phosphopantetheinyl transferase